MGKTARRALIAMEKRRFIIRVFVLVLSILFGSCDNTLESSGAGQATELSVSTPSSQGIDSVKLADAERQAEEMDNIASLLVIRNGDLILERYYHGADQSTAFNVKSVTKSLVSALAGIALKEGFISGLEQKVSDFFPEYFISGDNPQKREINIRHLLTMTSGLEWIENGPIVSTWVASSNWVQFALDLPLVHRPGEIFNYTTAGSHIISAVISKATKMSALDFGNKYLFRPAGIKVQRWDSDPQGNNFGGAEMYLTARDMAKFGFLYINGGSIDGKQIIPADWVEESTRVQADIGSGTQRDGYGYMWWIGHSKEVTVYSAMGYGGQFIFNIPELKMVVVSTSTLANSSDQNRINEHRTALFKILNNQIIPSAIK